MKSLKNKMAVITRASRGLGAESASALAKSGAFVIVNFKSNSPEADSVIVRIKAIGGDGIAIQGDVSSLNGISVFFNNVDDEFENRFADKHFDITVNPTAPGATDTDMNAGWLRNNPQSIARFSSIIALRRIGQASGGMHI